MVQLKDQLALHLLSYPKRWTDSRRLNSIASTLLMFMSDIGWFDAACDGLKHKRYKIDSRLLSDLYAICPTDLKLALVGTPAFFLLEPATFKRLLFDAWHLDALTAPQRQVLVSALETYLARNPEHANEYKDLILEALRSELRQLRSPGLHLAGYLDELPKEDLLRMKRSLTSARREFRMHAHNGLCRLVKRRREISPAVAAFCASPDIEATASRLQKSDPDDEVRLCAHYLVKALREARRDRSWGALKTSASRID